MAAAEAALADPQLIIDVGVIIVGQGDSGIGSSLTQKDQIGNFLKNVLVDILVPGTIRVIFLFFQSLIFIKASLVQLFFGNAILPCCLNENY